MPKAIKSLESSQDTQSFRIHALTIKDAWECRNSWEVNCQINFGLCIKRDAIPAQIAQCGYKYPQITDERLHFKHNALECRAKRTKIVPPSKYLRTETLTDCAACVRSAFELLSLPHRGWLIRVVESLSTLISRRNYMRHQTPCRAHHPLVQNNSQEKRKKSKKHFIFSSGLKIFWRWNLRSRWN